MESGLNIILRTVCGCERILAIPFKQYPPTFVVPYRRGSHYHVYPGDVESCLATLHGERRVFERTDVTGTYGYIVYVEKR